MEFLNNELLISLFNAVAPAGVQLGLAFGVAQVLFGFFMKLAFGRKEGSL